MASDLVLHVEQLSKCFKIYANPWHRAVEWATLGKRAYCQPFWALQDISFEVKRGEFFGIIGQNGAGKSTLLKILSGVLSPTSGTYQVNGRVLSMLELGMDFNPYLTGRENVLRSTELLGFPAGYVQARMAQIAEFSELGDFFDRPVRLYSTGMAARLAFSIYAFLDCDVLILDEVLAVGDLFFRQKCYARLEELIDKQTTIILVTHDMGPIHQYCDKVLVLHQGQKIFEGESQQAVVLYHQLRHHHMQIVSPVLPDHAVGDAGDTIQHNMDWPTDEVFTPNSDLASDYARLTRLAICNHRKEPCVNFNQGDSVCMYFEFELLRNIGVPVVAVRMTNQFNTVVHAKNSLQFDLKLPVSVKRGSTIRVFQSMALDIQPAEYIIQISLRTISPDEYARLDELARDGNFWAQRVLTIFPHQKVGYFTVHHDGMKIRYFGLCNLPGEQDLQVAPEMIPAIV